MVSPADALAGETCLVVPGTWIYARPMKATWKGTVIAESDDTVVVENNHYFPLEAVGKEHLRPSNHHTTCGWKGVASYYDVIVGGEVNKDACWFYPTPKPEAANIEGRVAFWKGVTFSP